MVEKKSHTERIKTLQEKIEALERAVGQKQMEIDILNKTLEFRKCSGLDSEQVSVSSKQVSVRSKMKSDLCRLLCL